VRDDPRDIDLSRAVWQRSSRSGSNGGQCVEVALSLPGVVAVRDSKDPDGQRLAFARDQWRRFVHQAKTGAYDL
jgi:Domain of unknown function (DUF397)